MTNQKSHHRKVSYNAYSTHIQASNRTIKDKKTNSKRYKNFPKQRKTIQKLKKFSQKYAQKGI